MRRTIVRERWISCGASCRLILGRGVLAQQLEYFCFDAASKSIDSVMPQETQTVPWTHSTTIGNIEVGAAEGTKDYFALTNIKFCFTWFNFHPSHHQGSQLTSPQVLSNTQYSIKNNNIAIYKELPLCKKTHYPSCCVSLCEHMQQQDTKRQRGPNKVIENCLNCFKVLASSASKKPRRLCKAEK